MKAEAGGAKRIALALSFANLVYLRVWFDLLASPAGAFHTKISAGWRDYSAALLNLLMVSAITWCAMRFGSRLRRWQQVLLVTCGVVLVCNAARAVAGTYSPLLRSGAFRFASPKLIGMSAGVVACFGIYVMFRYFDIATMLLRGGLLACLPVVPITVLSAVARLVQPPAVVEQEMPLARRLPQPRADVRVMWVIFDEWDNRLGFAARPRSLTLPALDALVARSLVGGRVLGPQGRVAVGEMATQVAIPSLLAGEPRKADQLDRPNLFASAHERGWNVAIGGWYMPYCRAFAADSFRCYWDQMYLQSTTHGATLGEAIRIENRSLFETSMYSLFGQSLTSERHRDEYRKILEFAVEVERDASAGLVFLHFNVPHAPQFYDAATRRFDAPGRAIGVAYSDALRLVDQTVGTLVEHLDSKTVLILSADHPLRIAEQVDGISDPHVPFLIHWPGQRVGFREDREFSSIRTTPLILAILDGKVRSPEEAARFLTKHE